MKQEITLAGGCFWGVQSFFDRIKGVQKTTAGYANGKFNDVTYEMVLTQTTDFAEAVQIIYEDNLVSLNYILHKYFQIIDPTLKNQQGNDRGTQYRTGIFYNPKTKASVLPIIKQVLQDEQQKYHTPMVVEVEPLKRFVRAEDYHQKYLEKHPQGYCHIDLSKADKD